MFDFLKGWSLNQPQMASLKQEGVETLTGGANFLQSMMALVVAKPLLALGALVVLGMVRNKQGGFDLGKFKVKM